MYVLSLPVEEVVCTCLFSVPIENAVIAVSSYKEASSVSVPRHDASRNIAENSAKKGKNFLFITNNILFLAANLSRIPQIAVVFSALLCNLLITRRFFKFV